MKSTVNFVKENSGKIFLGVIGIILIVFAIVLLALNMRNSKSSREQNYFSTAPADLVITNPGMAAPTPIGTTVFCFQLDGRQDGHLPALMGAAAQNAYPNGVSGYNWALPPTSTGVEPYGVLPDGTIFAKESFLKQYGMVNSVNLKGDVSGWAPMPMVKGEINSEAAYIFKR